MDQKTRDEVMKALATLVKAVPEVKDLFTNYHAPLEEGEIKTGPGEASSGAGAEHMIRQYSDPAPQIALAQEYKRVADMLSDFPTMKAQLDVIGSALSTILCKSVTKGRSLEQVTKSLETALVTHGVLKATNAKPEAIAKAEKRIASLRSEAEVLRSVQNLSLADAIKAVSGFAAKAEEEEEEEVSVVVNQGEDEEEAKAKGYAAAVQDISAYFEALSKGDEAAAAAALAKAPEAAKAAVTTMKALVVKANEEHAADGRFGEKGTAGAANKDEKDEKTKAEIAGLRKQIDELAKSLGGQSLGDGTAPNLGGSGEGTDVVRERVITALTENTLTPDLQSTAKSLLQQRDMVNAGKLGKDVFDRNLALAAPSVKSLFALN